jgi:Hemolysin-type calcium-binding repeat (2 copies)./Haemolysin-type calcium binding protein related domain.
VQGLTASALHATKSGNNLVLTDGVSGDQITLTSMWTTATDGVGSLKLSDGTILTRAQMIALEMTGTTGNDTITGTTGADLIDGKGGNDSVVGDGGNDTIIFHSGYGDLAINETFTSVQTPVLQLGTGITASTLKVKTSSSNLLLTDGVSGDQITLQGMATYSTRGVAAVHLADGTTLTRSQLIGMESATVTKASSAALATSGTTSSLQLNPLIHAMASYTGDSLGGGITSTFAPPVVSDLMLHAAA